MLSLQLLSAIMFVSCLCNELDEAILRLDAEIVNSVTDPEHKSSGGSVRKNVLRLELALGEICERLKDGDEEGKNAVKHIVDKGGLKLTSLDYVNDTLLMHKFNWSEDKCEELKYNLHQICSAWYSMEGGVINPTTMIYISGRNRTRGLQYMEKYLE